MEKTNELWMILGLPFCHNLIDLDLWGFLGSDWLIRSDDGFIGLSSFTVEYNRELMPHSQDYFNRS